MSASAARSTSAGRSAAARTTSARLRYPARASSSSARAAATPTSTSRATTRSRAGGRRSAWGPPSTAPCPSSAPPTSKPTGRAFLYFSRGPDIYSAELQADGSWGSVGPVSELNSTGSDLRPNVRKDGLEIVFDSNRASGTDQDLYFATRSSVDAAWSTPANAGSPINTSANETRGSFDRQAETLVFGRAPGPEGGSDIFFVTRTKVPGG